MNNLIWDERGIPHSSIFNDQYFCKDNGYAEGIHVCCHGNNLPERFAKLDPDASGVFTIIETGFGTGLDFCCAWELWDKCAPRSWKLNFISVELYSLLPDEIDRALRLWPSLDAYKKALVAQYVPLPGRAGEMIFDGSRVRLTIFFDDVVLALHRIKEREIAPLGADAWFLDGFGPAKNPRMWSDEVFAAMTKLSRTGTTCSTFTVAGLVRRGLEANGFAVKKIPGHGKKKEMLMGTCT